jgi:hypothetical protein
LTRVSTPAVYSYCTFRSSGSVICRIRPPSTLTTTIRPDASVTVSPVAVYASRTPACRGFSTDVSRPWASKP